jgi:hypothetical protein
MMVVVGVVVETVSESAMSLLVMEEEEGTIRIDTINVAVAVVVAAEVVIIIIIIIIIIANNIKLVPTPRHIYQSAITTKSIPMLSLTKNFKL